jgi:oligopeptide transport system permease protein
MKALLLKKTSAFFTSLLLVTTITFFLMKALPGNPFIGDTPIPAEVMESLQNHFGLADPLWKQYLRYVKGFLTFDFGPSLIYIERSVREIIFEGFSITFLLGLQAFALSLFFGVVLGSIASFYRLKWPGALLMSLATLGLSLPNFVFASLLQYVFAFKLHLLPVATWDSYLHTILPTLALSFMPTAYIARLIRSSMVEVLSQDYIKAAYAKGLSPFAIVCKHALPNALLPLLSYLAPIFTYLITGSFAVEKIFGIPGLGQWMISSILNRDYSTVMGLIVFYSMILIASSFIVDILYSWVNPRIAGLAKR